MKILIACEYSGIVRDAFRAKGHDAYSCDIIPTDSKPRYHIQKDVLEVLDDNWDMMIAHPPCTYLSRAGARWWKCPERQKLADKAAELVFALRDADIEKIAIENPIGQLNRRWRYPDQTIQPWQHGHPYSKATCLWLKNLPLLVPTNVIEEYAPFLPSNTGGKRKGEKWHAGKSSNAKDRAKFFSGVANAMADQWG